jgi:hypothetical protein
VTAHVDGIDDASPGVTAECVHESVHVLDQLALVLAVDCHVIVQLGELFENERVEEERFDFFVQRLVAQHVIVKHGQNLFDQLGTVFAYFGKCVLVDRAQDGCQRSIGRDCHVTVGPRARCDRG